jgi:plastocyanin
LTLHKKLKWFNLLAAGALLVSTAANADVISGDITFAKKAPFAGVLVVKQTQAASAEANMDQVNKIFTKKVTLGAPGSDVVFNNSDGFDHNIFANDLKNNISFDIGLMPSGQTSKLTMDWAEDTIVRIGCKIHPKMRSYIANVNSDYYQEFEFEKKVKTYPVNIADVPGDLNELQLLIPTYDKITVKLLKGESKTVEILKKGKVKGTLTVSRQ